MTAQKKLQNPFEIWSLPTNFCEEGVKIDIASFDYDVSGYSKFSTKTRYYWVIIFYCEDCEIYYVNSYR